jgi:hypothetical protein
VNDINWACEIIKGRYDNIEKQNLFADSSFFMVKGPVADATDAPQP